MARFPRDLSRARAIRTFEILGFRVIRTGAHIIMTRDNGDGTETPLVMPNHRTLKSSTLRAICTQLGVTREEFLQAVRQS